MGWVRKFRFSMATAMIAVVTAALASAVFARLHDHIPPGKRPYLVTDVPVLFVLSIALTAMGLGLLKSHSPKQIMLQMVLAFLSYFALILLAEAGAERPLLYWFQAACFFQAILPLIARNYVKTEMERGPRRTWWKKTTEAILFSFFTIVIVMVSCWMQFLTAVVLSSGNNLLNF